MDTKVLVAPKVEDFELLLKLLEQDGLPVVAAFLREGTSTRDRDLVIASPLVDRIGSLPVYERVQRALGELPGSGLTLDAVTVVGVGDPVVAHLRRALPEGFPIERFDVRMTVPDDTAEEADPVAIHMLRWRPDVRDAGAA